MGTRPVHRGDTGRRVAARVRALRREREWTLDDLSRRLGEAGRPLLSSGIAKIEDGSRRIDVDDLAALAEAFGVDASDLLSEHHRAYPDVANGVGTAFDATALSEEVVDAIAERVAEKLREDDRG